MKKRRRQSDPFPAKARLERVLSVATFITADKEDREFWWRQTPQARLRAAELMRRIKYGAAASGRMKRVIEIIHTDGTIQRFNG